MLTLGSGRLLGLITGDIDSGGIEYEGDPAVLRTLLSVLDRADPAFEIVLP